MIWKLSSSSLLVFYVFMLQFREFNLVSSQLTWITRLFGIILTWHISHQLALTRSIHKSKSTKCNRIRKRMTFKYMHIRIAKFFWLFWTKKQNTKKIFIWSGMVIWPLPRFELKKVLPDIVQMESVLTIIVWPEYGMLVSI